MVLMQKMPKYLLLHNKKEQGSLIFKVNQKESKKPTIVASTHKSFRNYPKPTKPFYLVFNLLEKEKDFLDRDYNIKLLKDYSEDKEAFPFTCKLSDLIRPPE